mgnify:CR=1 FL=1
MYTRLNRDLSRPHAVPIRVFQRVGSGPAVEVSRHGHGLSPWRIKGELDVYDYFPSPSVEGRRVVLLPEKEDGHENRGGCSLH